MKISQHKYNNLKCNDKKRKDIDDEEGKKQARISENCGTISKDTNIHLIGIT